jgi:hypothetical protein
MEIKRIWGTEERPFTSYSCGSLHTYYEQMGKIKIKYEQPMELNIDHADEKKD